MKPDNIQITTYNELNQESAPTSPASPYSIAGVLLEDTHILCGDCATQEELNIGHAIFEDTESDFPGIICDECSKPLDTYLLVYKNQDPDLWHKLVWNNQLGNLTNMHFSDEKLAKQAENMAYEEGWQEGKSMANTLSPADIESNPRMGEYRTDTAHYANNIAPELRAISGFIDSMGKGTYQESFRDISYHTFNEGVNPAFHAGFTDRLIQGREKWQSRTHHDLD